MKEFVEITRGEGPYVTGPLLKDTGGQICRKKRRSMLKSATNVKDSLPTSTSLEEFLIPFPALGLLLNGRSEERRVGKEC